MWSSEITSLPGHQGQHVRLYHQGEAVSYARLLEALVEDSAARALLLQVLASAAYAAYYWEVVPVCKASLDRPFECVLLDAVSLIGEPPDPDTFGRYFRADADVVRFDNLGGDALLVAPCPRGTLAAYAHLASFVREAPIEQRHELLRQVARSVCERLTHRPLWLSTAGNGVAWVHVRLDQSPKYYRHAAYRTHGLGIRC